MAAVAQSGDSSGAPRSSPLGMSSLPTLSRLGCDQPVDPRVVGGAVDLGDMRPRCVAAIVAISNCRNAPR